MSALSLARLPTGPEWYYASKAGTTSNTYNGYMTDDHGEGCADEPILNDIAWYCENTGAGNYDGCGSFRPTVMRPS